MRLLWQGTLKSISFLNQNLEVEDPLFEKIGDELFSYYYIRLGTF